MNILPHKDWNPWNRENIEKVLVDERKHREAQEKARLHKEQIESEKRRKLLLERKGKRLTQDGTAAVDIQTVSTTDNFVENVRSVLIMPPPIDTGNEEYQKEAQVKRDKFEKEYLKRYLVEKNEKKPWYVGSQSTLDNINSQPDHSSDDEIDDQTQTWKQYGSNKHSDRVARDRRKRLQKIEDPLTLMNELKRLKDNPGASADDLFKLPDERDLPYNAQIAAHGGGKNNRSRFDQKHSNNRRNNNHNNNNNNSQVSVASTASNRTNEQRLAARRNRPNMFSDAPPPSLQERFDQQSSPSLSSPSATKEKKRKHSVDSSASSDDDDKKKSKKSKKSKKKRKHSKKSKKIETDIEKLRRERLEREKAEKKSVKNLIFGEKVDLSKFKRPMDERQLPYNTRFK